MGVEFQEWLRILRAEYLEDFVLEGGAAVKFVTVADEAAANHVATDVAHCAASGGYLVARVDSSTARIHLMQDLFHAVARQIPWEDLARRVIRRCYEELGYSVVGEDLRFSAVAAQHGQEPGPLGVEMRTAIQGLLPLTSALARDFRYAMLWMCMGQLNPGGGGAESIHIVLDWLCGDLKLASAVKKLLIFRKIGRHNARAMLSSLGAWCRLAGYSGLVLVLDIRQLAIARRSDAVDGRLFYTIAAVLDAYEVLRQCIDATDDLTGVLGVIVASPELFDDEKRGVKVYKALYERVWPDVRLRARPNPLSSLANLEVAL